MIHCNARPLLVPGVWTIPKPYPIAGGMHGVVLRATLYLGSGELADGP